MRQAKYWIFLLPLFLLLTCVGAYAQANSEVTGIITDQTGALVAGANVSLTDPATGFNRATVSGSTGLFEVGGLNPGNYNLKVIAKGFETYTQTGIVVNVSGTFTVNVKLTLGAETTTVSVVADALAVQTDSNVVSTLINSEEITSIATENRNFTALAALGMGVSSGLPDQNTLGAFGSTYTISINGLRESHNIWLIDGGESDDRGAGGNAQIMPSQDAIAEMSMLTSNYPPDYGISSGATISLSLKSGTKSFHGSGWEENRATAYDANSYFNKQSGNARAATHWNIYGFNVGGPVYIPHTYNTDKQKTFFFYNEEWRKTSSVSTSNNATIDPKDVPSSANVTAAGLPYVLPTYANLGAPNNLITALVVPNVAYPGASTPGDSDFYENRLKALNLTPGAAFPNNTIPAKLFDANAVTYLTSGVLPAPNVGTTDYNVASAPTPVKVRDDIFRIDHNFNDKWAILMHYIGDSQVQGYAKPELGWCGCNYNTLGSTLTSPAHSAAVKLSGTITPNLLVEASINYDGNGADIVPSANTFLPSNWTVAPVVPAYAITRKVWPGMGWGSTLPNGGGGGLSEDTATEPYHNAAQDYEPKVDVSYTVGKHAYKFGASYNRYTKNQMIYGDEQGNYSFGQLSNDTLMDTLMGLSSGYSQDLVAPIRHYANQTPSVYAMDNWHVTPRLTLQLGLRYDAMPHTWERQNLMGNFSQDAYVPGAANAPIWTSANTISATSPNLYEYAGIDSYINGTLLVGQNGVGVGGVKNDYDTLQYRIGFSEDLFGNGKTVLRGGFGTFFERMQGNDAFNVATSAPFNPSLSLGANYFSTPGTTWNTIDPATSKGVTILPTQLIFAGASGSIAQTYRAPAVAMFSLGVQHELSPSVIWVVQYVGNIAWHQNVIDNGLNAMSPSIGVVNIAAPTAAANLQDARCVAGDGGSKYNPQNLPKGSALPDDACKAGFGNYGGMNAFRQYPGYAGIAQDQNNTNGNYNGFQTGVRIQNRWGLSGEVDYTYSHEIDITYEDRDNLDNPWNPKYDKGSGNLDRRNLLNANYIYNLPLFNKSEGLLKSIAGGWQIAGTIVDQSGVPVTVGLSASYDPVGLGGGYTNRPNITNPGTKLHYTKSVSNWFDSSRIDNGVVPSWMGGTSLGFGNWGRDTLVGPGRVNFTTSVYKNFQIYKTATFQIRGESFNTFNHSEFNGVNVGAGTLNGTYDPRALELGGRFLF